MGVPAFFRWLSRKYPSIIVHCLEEKAKEYNGIKIPVDTSKPNPNEVEFDNLYLDMNGIIHPCTHPEDKPAPKNEDEMMVAIFEYIDRLFNIVRPRRVLYMAIDGVAPRAKMNQQRSRRFRASKEGVELVEEKNKMREEVIQRGGYLPPEEIKERFDSNCITPGTEFMDNLAKCLRYYIADRLTNDPGWHNITVFLSDASVPGEGEHKIMDFIRRQRGRAENPGYADLIMLGLATHEPNFTIIREEFKPNKPRPCALCGQMGHEIKDCQGLAREKQGEHDEFADTVPVSEQEFIFIRLIVLREYLERELTMASLPFPFNFERSVDDWVFMCFFVGNDFLPHLPSLEIREGAIDRLVGIYKDVVHKTGGYLTENGFVNLERVELIMQAVGVAEDNIFKKRKDDDVRPHSRCCLLSTRRSGGPAGASNDMDNRGVKRKAEDSDSEPEPEDNVRLWEEGWKQRYYKTKFDVDATDDEFRKKVVQSYVEGLCWVLRYYYQVNHTSATESSIIDFYPDDFAIDLNGKKYAWQGVALLPFVDERRLRAALADVYPDLSPEEGEAYSFIAKQYKSRNTGQSCCTIPAELCHGIQGTIHLPWFCFFFLYFLCFVITWAISVEIKFKDPQYDDGFVFKAVILPGAKIPNKVLKPGDWEQSNRGPWRPQLGFNPNRQQAHLDQSGFRKLK
uniref:5'-3' exoribonuclease n=1 Tax=Cyprinus carpio TaxID=7962 RepID=A0A8C1QCB2_CYPCA